MAWIRRSAGGRRRPFAGMKLLPEGRSLVGRGRILTKTKNTSGCRWRKGYRSYLFLPFVCLYFDNLHRNLRRFRRCVFSGFVYSPARRENCAVGERRSRRPSGALFWRAFLADERRLWAYFARNGPSLCHLQTIQRPRVRSAVLSSLFQTDRGGSRRLLSFWPRSLSNAVRFNFGRAVLSFCRLPLFLFWQCSPAVRISAFLLCGRAYGNLGRTMRAARRFVCRFLRFLRASDVRVSRKARPAFYGGRALWDVSRETLTNAALCATIDTQSAE